MVAAGKEDFKSINVGGDVVVAVALEARLRSQGIRVVRLEPDIESPAPNSPYRLLVSAEDVPLAVELLEELTENPAS